ncbi:MAG: hypothetical protein V4589_05540 [Bacteroidota bacterium]
MNNSRDQAIYDKIYKYYFEDNLSIRKACAKENICANTYNNICRRLNLKSAAKLNYDVDLLNNKKQIFSNSNVNEPIIKLFPSKRDDRSLLDRAISSERMIQNGGRNKNIVVDKIYKKDKKIESNSINERQRTDKFKIEDDNNSDEEFFRKCRSAAGI